VIRISSRAIPVVEANCRRCHAAVIGEVAIGRVPLAACKPVPQETRVGKPPVAPCTDSPQGLLCWDCHRDVPHGTVRSLSASPELFRPQLAPLTSGDQQSQIQGRPVRPAKEPTHE
jgi:cytochrome c nitrite reductase small subunit